MDSSDRTSEQTNEDASTDQTRIADASLRLADAEALRLAATVVTTSYGAGLAVHFEKD